MKRIKLKVKGYWKRNGLFRKYVKEHELVIPITKHISYPKLRLKEHPKK